MASLATGCGDTNDSSSSDKAEATTESESDTLQDALTSEISKDGASDADKEETVYVLADANGNANDVTVSTWLKNSDGAEGLNDKTNLTDIQNVKGYEEYKDNGDGTITWAANGSDIYYQGKSNEELPVDVKVTYKLDRGCSVLYDIIFVSLEELCVRGDGHQQSVRAVFLAVERAFFAQERGIRPHGIGEQERDLFARGRQCPDHLV